MDYNPVLDTDSYKPSQVPLIRPDVTKVYSYAESRGGAYPETVFFGLQPYLYRMVENPVTKAHLEEAVDFWKAHGLPDCEQRERGWQMIIDYYGGHMPLEIKAAAEGSLIPIRNVLATSENTDRVLPWLVSDRETSLLRQVWYGTTVATRIFNMKRDIKHYFTMTADSYDNLPFALLDFSARGCASYDANLLGGAAYLANFLGSDSMSAVRYVNRYYDSPMSGFSVTASEHSVTTAWGRDELARMKHAIANTPVNGILSDVVDTWDCYEAARLWGTLALDLAAKNITLVVRPDSGDMFIVVSRLLEILEKGFGSTINRKGYRVLNGVKILWGDGINESTCTHPFETAMSSGYSADSIMVGSGGGLMQANIDRDTCKFAFKASAIETQDGTNFTWTGVAKDPITDPGKKSKMGRLHLVSDLGVYETVDDAKYETMHLSPGIRRKDHLRTVYKDGELMNLDTIDAIRSRIDSQL